MRSALVVVLDLFCVLLVIRGVLSWFRLTPGSGWDRLRATSARFTEPILRRTFPIAWRQHMHGDPRGVQPAGQTSGPRLA